MREIYAESLAEMHEAFRRLECQIEPPVKVLIHGNYTHRYREKGLKQAILQKLARSISGLHAINLLLLNGFTQEQGVLHRILDEIHEDILFLKIGIAEGNLSERHRKYLDAFYLEQIPPTHEDHNEIKKPDLLPRKKIRAYINNALNIKPSNDINEFISLLYSGFVHAASPNIMDMFDETSHCFQITGIKETQKIEDYKDDAWNYFYRGLLATIHTAQAFKDEGLEMAIYLYTKSFEQKSGTSYLHYPAMDKRA